MSPGVDEGGERRAACQPPWWRCLRRSQHVRVSVIAKVKSLPPLAIVMLEAETDVTFPSAILRRVLDAATTGPGAADALDVQRVISTVFLPIPHQDGVPSLEELVDSRSRVARLRGLHFLGSARTSRWVSLST